MKTPITAPTRLSRLIQLNARTSELMEFMDRETFKQRFGRYPEEAYNETVDPDQVRSQRKVIGATAAGAGLVGAGFVGQRAINKAGGYGAVATKTAQAATDVGKRTASYAGKIGTELKYARNLGGALRSGPLDIAKDFLKRAKGVRFEASHGALIRLSSVLDEVVELDEDNGVDRRKAKIGIGAGVGAGYIIGRRGGYLRHSPDAIKKSKAIDEAVAKAVKRASAQGQGSGTTIKRVVKAAYKSAKNVRLNEILDELIEFESPLGKFNRTQQEDLKKAQDKIHRESYVRRGAAIGAGAGAATGATTGMFVGKHVGGKRGAALGGAMGAFYGGLGGLIGGVQVGGRIRRKIPLPASNK